MTTTILNYSDSGFTFAATFDRLYVLDGGHVFNASGNAVSSTVYATVYDYGDIIGAGSGVYLSNGGEIHIAASGHVAGVYGIYTTGSAANIFNSGLIDGDYGIIANVPSKLINTGSIISNSIAYSGSDGADTIQNSGLMIGGVAFSSGNDFYDGRGGSVIGTVNGDTGDDILVGGNAADKFRDDSGSNWIVGGGGDDTITLGNNNTGRTIAFGGEANGVDNSGNDTLEFTLGLAAVNVFLNSGYVADSASGLVVAWISGFENGTGSFYADTIVGTTGNNVINGSFGGDWLVGNGGNDRFVFDTAERDTIADFSKDIIDLHTIDANSAVAGDQAFIWQASHTNNAAGELVFTNYGSGGVINIYTNADNTVDGTIYVSYASGAAAPVQNDFIL